MLKLGVVDRLQLRHPITLLGRRRHVSFLLLQELARQPDVEPDEYDRLAGLAPMPNGVWKRTSHGRLRLLDSLALDLIGQRFPDGAQLTVADVAASTGVTSVEFYRTLRRRFDVRFIASDRYRDLIAVRSRRWPASVVFDPTGREVQYVFHRFVVPASLRESAAYPINRLVKALIQWRLLPAAREVFQQTDRASLSWFQESRVGDYEVVKLPVLTKETIEAIDARSGFSFDESDILEPLPIRAHVVRAMNILTRNHFSRELRVRALHNCINAVISPGLFIVGWSPTPSPSTVEASVYAVEDGTVTALAKVNGGSEIDEIIAATFPIARPTLAADDGGAREVCATVRTA